MKPNSRVPGQNNSIDCEESRSRYSMQTALLRLQRKHPCVCVSVSVPYSLDHSTPLSTGHYGITFFQWIHFAIPEHFSCVLYQLFFLSVYICILPTSRPPALKVWFDGYARPIWLPLTLHIVPEHIETLREPFNRAVLRVNALFGVG